MYVHTHTLTHNIHSPDQCVHLGYINVIELFDSLLDLWFVGANVYYEDECVVVLDLLHGRLSG